MSVKPGTIINKRKLVAAVKNVTDDCHLKGFTGKLVISFERGHITNTRLEKNYNNDDLLTEFGDAPRKYTVKAAAGTKKDNDDVEA